MQPVGDWYLIANRNDLAVKILGAITVGETADGELVIDGRDAADRWVTLTVDDAQQLLVSYQQQRCTLESPGKWVTHGAGLAVPKGTLFELPNNEIYVSGDLQRGVVEQRVLVSCRLDEPLPEPVAEPLPPTPVTKPVVQADLRETPVDTGGVAAGITEADADRAQTSPEPNIISSPTASPAQRRPASRSVWKWAAFALLPLGAALYFAPDLKNILGEETSSPVVVSQDPISAQIEPLEHEATEPAPDIEAESELAPEPDSAGSPLIAATTNAIEFADAMEPEVEPQLEDALLDTTVDEPERFELAQAQEPSATDTPALMTDVAASNAEPASMEMSGLDEPIEVTEVSAEEHLDRARRLLADGFVTWPPEDNAVLRLQQVLAADPSNEEALRLLDEAAETLLNEAQLAYEDGFDEGALQVVDSVLAFNPGMRRARELRMVIANR